ncbi:hypothetical protein PG984_008039 [Apiospora sp. TS-2023a]
MPAHVQFRQSPGDCHQPRTNPKLLHSQPDRNHTANGRHEPHKVANEPKQRFAGRIQLAHHDALVERHGDRSCRRPRPANQAIIHPRCAAVLSCARNPDKAPTITMGASRSTIDAVKRTRYSHVATGRTSSATRLAGLVHVGRVHQVHGLVLGRQDAGGEVHEGHDGVGGGREAEGGVSIRVDLGAARAVQRDDGPDALG